MLFSFPTSYLFDKELGLVWKYVANNSIDLSGSIEQVSSSACSCGVNSFSCFISVLAAGVLNSDKILVIKGMF